MRPTLEATGLSRTRGPRYDGRPATLRGFDRLPHDGYRYELHNGTLHVAPANQQIVGKQRLRGAPDLVVEVVSPDDPDRDWRVKFS